MGRLLGHLPRLLWHESACLSKNRVQRSRSLGHLNLLQQSQSLGHLDFHRVQRSRSLGHLDFRVKKAGKWSILLLTSRRLFKSTCLSKNRVQRSRRQRRKQRRRQRRQRRWRQTKCRRLPPSYRKISYSNRASTRRWRQEKRRRLPLSYRKISCSRGGRQTKWQANRQREWKSCLHKRNNYPLKRGRMQAKYRSRRVDPWILQRSLAMVIDLLFLLKFQAQSRVTPGNYSTDLSWVNNQLPTKLTLQKISVLCVLIALCQACYLEPMIWRLIEKPRKGWS